MRTEAASDWTLYNRFDAVLRRYAKQLRRRSWEGVCGALKGAAGQSRAWRLLRALSTTPTNRNPLLALSIASGKSALELAEDFATFLAPATAAQEDESTHAHTRDTPAPNPPLPPASEETPATPLAPMSPPATATTSTSHADVTPSPATSSPAPSFPPTHAADILAAFDAPFTAAELARAIQNVKRKSAPGADGITYQAIKNLNEEQRSLLLDFYNHHWISGTLPEQFGLQLVSPILKKNKSKLFSSYRPISLTSAASKILESSWQRSCVVRTRQQYEGRHPSARHCQTWSSSGSGRTATSYSGVPSGAGGQVTGLSNDEQTPSVDDGLGSGARRAGSPSAPPWTRAETQPEPGVSSRPCCALPPPVGAHCKLPLF